MKFNALQENLIFYILLLFIKIYFIVAEYKYNATNMEIETK